MYISALLAVSVQLTNHAGLSRNRLPSISIPTRGAVEGRIMQTTMVITIRGTEYFSSLDTGTQLIHLDLLSFCRW